MSETLRQSIYAEIEIERAYQEGRWGVEADDTKNQPNDWIAYISHYATAWFRGEFSPYAKTTGLDFRTAMVKVATIAVAAIESYDRQVAAKGKPFYEAE